MLASFVSNIAFPPSNAIMAQNAKNQPPLAKNPEEGYLYYS
jgi:hypothetical protein